MSESMEWKIGPHSVILEPPDTLRISYRGPMALEDATALVALYLELTQIHSLYAIVDMGAAEPLEPEIQRYLGDHMRPEWFRLTVYYGVRLVHKAMIKGIVMATQLTASPPSTDKLLGNIFYVATRAEAEQLMHELRGRLIAQAG